MSKPYKTYKEKPKTQHQIILEALTYLRAAGKNDGWRTAFSLAGKMTPFGFVGASADRRLRELRDEGKVESRRNGQFEEFRIP